MAFELAMVSCITFSTSNLRLFSFQIKLIREKSEKLKERIYEYERAMTNQVEEYSSLLMTKKDQLEVSYTKVHKWLRDSHVTKLVQRRQQMSEELERETDVELGRSGELISKPVIINKGIFYNVIKNVDVVNTPTSLTFKSEHDTNGSCYSAFYKKDGDLLLGCSSGVGLLGHRDNQITKYDTEHDGLTSLVEHHRNVFLLGRADDVYLVEMCLPGVTQREKLFEFQRTSTAAAFLAVSDEYVVAVNPGANALLLYDFLTKQTVTLAPTVNPTNVCFLPDGDLLVLSFSDHSIVRYRIENNQLTPVWTCEDIADSYGVCTDHNGLIYVCTLNGRQTIYILSPEGIFCYITLCFCLLNVMQEVMR